MLGPSDSPLGKGEVGRGSSEDVPWAVPSSHRQHRGARVITQGEVCPVSPAVNCHPFPISPPSPFLSSPHPFPSLFTPFPPLLCLLFHFFSVPFPLSCIPQHSAGSQCSRAVLCCHSHEFQLKNLWRSQGQDGAVGICPFQLQHPHPQLSSHPCHSPAWP